MFRRVFLVLALLCSLFVSGAPALQAREAQSTVQTKDCVVYVTRTGHKYHKAGCSYLKRSAIQTTRAEALKAGYSPCSRCGGSACE